VGKAQRAHHFFTPDGGHGAKSAFAHPTKLRNQEAVIASEAKQSIGRQKRKLDCFVASAPRNDVQMQLRDLAAGFLRDILQKIPYPPKRGRREAGRLMHP
jgi:hypothetical protein